MKKTNFYGLLAVFAMLFIGVTSCKDNGDDPNAGKIDPSTIATDSLVAYFPFDGNGVDQISSLTPSSNSYVTYVTGRRNQCYQGDTLAYLKYSLSSTSKLATMTDGFTVSAWVKSSAINGKSAPAQGILQIDRSDGDTNWGNLNWFQERDNQETSTDSCFYKCTFNANSDTNWGVENFFSKFLANKWQYITLTYNSTTSIFNMYINGVVYSERTHDSNGAGELTFTGADYMVVGTWVNNAVYTAVSWQDYFRGNLDELRIYNAGLSASQVKELYDAEVTQLTE
ncbi:MAG: LamG domain-containing protein [Paludibacter sp.]|nr:LamG domain-containing protein [Paludibacter sp.]